MENSQVQNDLKRKFFVVLIMLGVFFVSDAFCHNYEGPAHTHDDCPLDGDFPKNDDGTPTLETILHYPRCFFIALPSPDPDPQTPDPDPQTPDPNPRQPQQRPPDPDPQTPDPNPRQPQQRPSQTPGTNRPPATSNPQPGNDPQPANDGSQPTGNDSQPTGNDPQPANDGSQPATDESQDIERLPTTQIVPTGISPQPVANTVKRPTAATSTLKDILITEYMCLDWSNHIRNLPQWVELYNPNNSDVDITGYKFYYAEWNRRASKLEINDTPITLDITIPAKDAIILSTKKVPNQETRIGGISEEHVFVLDIANVLKKGWRIVDTDGDVVHEIGMLFTDGLIGNPVLPKHVEKARQSFKRYASETPGDDHYYGHWQDIGSPGFYREETVRAAPTLLKKRLLNTSWASLRKRR